MPKLHPASAEIIPILPFGVVPARRRPKRRRPPRRPGPPTSRSGRPWTIPFLPAFLRTLEEPGTPTIA